MNAKAEALLTAVSNLRRFMPTTEIDTLSDNIHGEEGEYFAQLILDTWKLIETMPKTYEQDDKGEEAVAHLHYFAGSADWFITERDAEPVQHQAFGLADLGYGPELGYISIVELIQNGVELDLHWTPKTLGEIQAKQAV